MISYVRHVQRNLIIISQQSASSVGSMIMFDIRTYSKRTESRIAKPIILILARNEVQCNKMSEAQAQAR